MRRNSAENVSTMKSRAYFVIEKRSVFQTSNAWFSYFIACQGQYAVVGSDKIVRAGFNRNRLAAASDAGSAIAKNIVDGGKSLKVDNKTNAAETISPGAIAWVISTKVMLGLMPSITPFMLPT